MPTAKKLGRARLRSMPSNDKMSAVRSWSEADQWNIHQNGKMIYSGLTTEEKDKVLRGEKLDD